jgi:aryl-alcohol dehydrogenase-like predicted oxidoreductase
MYRNDDDGVLPLCRQLGIGYVPYFPLESGLLTGKYRRGEPHPEGARLTGSDDRLTDERLERVEALEELAGERDVALLEIAIGGLASIPGIASVIAGATSPEQVRANARAGAWRATAEDLAAIERGHA